MKELLCPFRKETLYESGRNTGLGYPDVWKARESFCECLREQCTMWCPVDPPNEDGTDGWCAMPR